jgi:hypothetical protein
LGCLLLIAFHCMNMALDCLQIKVNRQANTLNTRDCPAQRLRFFAATPTLIWKSRQGYPPMALPAIGFGDHAKAH